MHELDYRPNSAARSLARGKTGVIGIILITLQDSFFDSVIDEINVALRSHGYYPAVSVARNLNSEEGHYLIDEDRVDGLILLSPLEETSFIEEMNLRGIPYVLVDNQIPEAPYSVTVDNVFGGYVATRHLIELGHTEIAHLCADELFRSTRDRRSGYQQALDEAGLVPFEIVQGAFDIEFGYHTAKGWLKSGKLPTAVFAGDDYIAVGLINAFLEMGVRVPQDVSVVGFDDQLLASRLHPHLTTVRQPARPLAVHAVDLLMNRISGGNQQAKLRIQPELVVRVSTAPPPKNGEGTAELLEIK
ncbi:MAG: LacI family transcriptional regulator, partial [Gorillibacterium sp.]|nr:LacI family transcriptional regulator [Gorillibacterium sp.]